MATKPTNVDVRVYVASNDLKRDVKNIIENLERISKNAGEIAKGLKEFPEEKYSEIHMGFFYSLGIGGINNTIATTANNIEKQLISAEMNVAILRTANECKNVEEWK
jgi:hypothetical protein